MYDIIRIVSYHIKLNNYTRTKKKYLYYIFFTRSSISTGILVDYYIFYQKMYEYNFLVFF